ncbi:unnamed protein product, partial [Mesorhabditis belari]|uniref:Fungal lipase-like domain-containing protein n=1 Tax=Mesorhabditis belari TaxID=2138241 RepID=A0AAF3FI97_9BILA
MTSNLYLPIFVFLFFGVIAEYSDDFSRNVMFPLAVAAFDKNPGVCIKSGTGDGLLRRQIELPCDVINETCSGYSAFSSSKNAIILGWRGSVGTYEVDLETIDILFGKQLTFPGGSKVADFFYNAFLKLWNAGIKDDYLTLRQQNPNAEVWVTGHSLGAAMSALCAGYLAQLGLADGNKIKLITYGEPRNGDKDYATLINTKIPYSYRVVHDSDIVPHIPFNIENYEHHGTEIWYQNKMNVNDKYTVCKGNEDKSCSKSVTPDQWNWDAHGFYYGTNIGQFENRGCVF